MKTIRLCSIETCNNKHLAKGMCRAHYLRHYKHGDATICKFVPTPKAEISAFISKAICFDGCDCLPWPFSLDWAGYSKVKRNGKTQHAHRYILELVSPFPFDGAQAAHSCGNRVCCNPKHLRWATAKENSQDRIIHGTQAFGQDVKNSKLRNEQVEFIKSELNAGVPGVVLAKKFNVSKSCISLIRKGKRWR